MGALGALARQYAGWLIALLFVAAIGGAWLKFDAVQTELTEANTKIKSLDDQRVELTNAVGTVKESVRTLEAARVADNAAVKSATDGVALARQEARQARENFDQRIANDEAARNFLDLHLPDALRLHLQRPSVDHGSGDPDLDATGNTGGPLPGAET